METHSHFQHKQRTINRKMSHGKCTKYMAHQGKAGPWDTRLLAARYISNGAL
jgi:hypothetical protein